jgi:hypothetical protein
MEAFSSHVLSKEIDVSNKIQVKTPFMETTLQL